MTALAKRKSRLTFETSDCVRYRGRLREVVIEATEYAAAVRLKGTRQRFDISWAGGEAAGRKTDQKTQNSTIKGDSHYVEQV